MAEIIPAILTNDPSELSAKLDSLIGLTEWVQIDIMDGRFVPQISISLDQLSRLNSPFQFDVHLMVNNPEQYLEGCQTANVKRVLFQLEGTEDPEAVLSAMSIHGFERGIALRPQTPVEAIQPYLSWVTVVLLLSVEPGKQGQAFIPETIERIKQLRQIAPEVKIEVDGGINADNIAEVAAAGADYLVVGSAIVGQPSPAAALNELKAKINGQ